MLGIKVLKAGKHCRESGNANGEGKETALQKPQSDLWPWMTFICRGLNQSPHSPLGHAHVHFRAQVTVPKVMWH